MKITVNRLHGVAVWKWGIDEEVSPVAKEKSRLCPSLSNYFVISISMILIYLISYVEFAACLLRRAALAYAFLVTIVRRFLVNVVTLCICNVF